MTRHDAASVMAVMSDAAEGGADLRLFADELIVNLRALLLLRVGADARLTDELPADEVAWLRERASAWSIGVLMQLVQTLSDALARTRDAAQFQVQTEVAMLSACDVESLAPPPVRPTAELPPVHPTAKPVEATLVTIVADEPIATVAVDGPEAPGVTVVVEEAVETASQGRSLGDRWPDVVEQIQRRNGLLASIVRSAHPLTLEDVVLTVAFSTEYNRKAADKSTNRQVIEAALERVYGAAYRLRAIVAAESGPSLLDDSVINFAQRTFGGQPKRVPTDER